MDETIYDYIKLSEVDTSNDEYVIVKGYANKYKWNGEVEVDSFGTTFLPTSYDLSTYKLNPVILYMHDVNMPVGKCTTIKITDEGLYIEAMIYKSINLTVFNSVKAGVLNGFSIGIHIKAEQYSEILDAYVVTAGELIEISLVTTPSNNKSVIEKVSLCELGTCQVLRQRKPTTRNVDKAMITKIVKNLLTK
jgi:HK97 family phage prohead protease